jgi:hypothetical protein
MSLAKATITKVGGGAGFEVDFNPESYSVKTSADVAKNKKPLEFIKIKKENFNVTLLFDTYDDRVSVKARVKVLTDYLTSMGMKIKNGKKNPPEVIFSWGSNFSYKGVITEIKETYTLFLADGTPVRCKLDLTMECVESPEEMEKNAGIDACRKVRVVKQGDRLDMIAFEMLGDSMLWREIVNENINLIPDPRNFPTSEQIGATLLIPDYYKMERA